MRRIDWSDVYLLTIIALMRCVTWTRSSRVRDVVASIIARVAHQVSRRKSQGIDTHLPNTIDRAQHARIAQGAFNSFWRDAFELADVRESDERVEIRGLEHLTRAAAQGYGAILLESSSFGRRNFAKRLLSTRGIAIHQTHSLAHMGGFWTHGETETRTRTVRPILDQLERRFVAEIIYLPQDESLAFTRRLMQVLQSNHVLCLSGEGQIGQKRIVLSFLGRERAFATGIISLAKLTGAPILPVFCWRDEDGKTHLVIEPPLDLTVGMSTYAAQLEAHALRHPEQYHGWYP